MENEHQRPHAAMKHSGNPYVKLLTMAVLSFLFMYILMYAMVDSLKTVYPNINQFYMASLMAMPMIIIVLLLMGKMRSEEHTSELQYIMRISYSVLCMKKKKNIP